MSWAGYSVESIKWPYLHITCSGFCSQDLTGWLSAEWVPFGPLADQQLVPLVSLLGFPRISLNASLVLLRPSNLERKPAQKREENLVELSCYFSISLRQGAGGRMRATQQELDNRIKIGSIGFTLMDGMDGDFEPNSVASH
jgi:hypothetical protein